MLKSEMEELIEELQVSVRQKDKNNRTLENKIAKYYMDLNGLTQTVKRLEGDIDSYDTALKHSTESAKSLIEKNSGLIDDRHRLIKKLEALEASLDVIAMAATAGLAVTEL